MFHKIKQVPTCYIYFLKVKLYNDAAILYNFLSCKSKIILCLSLYVCLVQIQTKCNSNYSISKNVNVGIIVTILGLPWVLMYSINYNDIYFGHIFVGIIS